MDYIKTVLLPISNQSLLATILDTMKLFLTTLVVALAGVASATHLSRDVYPCPHSGTSRLAHLSSCSKFVQCVNGVAVEESCASGLFFNAELQQCTWASLANCNVERNPCPTWTDPENLVFLANGANCNNYFMCFDGHPLSMNCASGLSFNRNLDQCDYVQCFVSTIRDADIPVCDRTIEAKPDVFSLDLTLVLWRQWIVPR